MRWVLVALCAVVVACGGAANETRRDGGAAPQDGGGGVQTVVSGLATTPYLMVSDGTSLYWTDINTGNITTMPVKGGKTNILATMSGWEFIAVDGTYVYYLGPNGLDATPKSGGTAIRLSDGSGSPSAGTISGSTAYWAQLSVAGPTAQLQIKSAAIPSGASSLVAEISSGVANLVQQMVVASGAIFYTAVHLNVIRIGGSAPMLVPVGCQYLLSDTQSAYCVPRDGDATEIVADGTVTNLTPVVNAQGSALDASYLYAATNPATAGTIVKMPKQGGSSTIVATDSVPVAAVAVDDAAIYWATTDGHIRKVAK
jgi:hypothetical protein